MFERADGCCGGAFSLPFDDPLVSTRPLALIVGEPSDPTLPLAHRNHLKLIQILIGMRKIDNMTLNILDKLTSMS